MINNVYETNLLENCFKKLGCVNLLGKIHKKNVIKLKYTWKRLMKANFANATWPYEIIYLCVGTLTNFCTVIVSHTLLC